MNCPKCGSEVERRTLDNPNEETKFGYRCLNIKCKLFRKFQEQHTCTYQQRLDKVLSKFEKWSFLNVWSLQVKQYKESHYDIVFFEIRYNNKIFFIPYDGVSQTLSLETVESLLKDLEEDKNAKI